MTNPDTSPDVSAPPITVAIHGACGRMGRRLIEMTLDAPDLDLIAAIDRAGTPDDGRDVGEMAGRQACGVKVASEWTGVRPEVVIDFSTASALPGLIEAATEHSGSLVVCTTGFDAEVHKRLREAAHHIAVLVSPNMATGVNLVLALVEQTARALGATADIEVVEMHHRHKIDAPSGTAKAIAARIAWGLGVTLDDVATYGREGRYPGGRPQGEVAIHTLRGGDVVGDHTAVFALEGERIEITHRATSRDVFAAGALRAARWLASKPAGWYTMAQVLGLEE